MNPKELKSPFYGMTDGMFVRLDFNLVVLGQQNDMLKNLAEAMPTNLPNAFVVPGGELVHIQTRGGNILCWKELKSLRINAVYTIASDGTRYPTFKPVNDSRPLTTPEHENAFVWEPAIAQMRMFFASLYVRSGGGDYQYSMSYLLAKAPKRKEVFRPPLTNIFADSRVCMGGSYVHTNKCLADAFNHSLIHLDNSRWIIDGAAEGMTPEAAKLLYSFKDNKQVPPPEGFKWWESSPGAHAVNNMNYSELPLV